MKLLPEWCDKIKECESEEHRDEFFFADDNTCECGIDKHHYHCLLHGKIIQIG